MDILVSNAGTFPESMALEKITDKKWALDMEINLGSHHKVLRECIPYLKYGINILFNLFCSIFVKITPLTLF